MNLVIGVNPDTPAEVIVFDPVLGGIPQLQANVRAVGEVVIRNHVVVREPEIQAVGVVGGHIVPDGAAVNIFHQNRTAQLVAPAAVGIGIVVGEIIVFNG